MIIGSRGSLLAIAQTQLIVKLLTAVDPSLQIETKIIKTNGDELAEKWGLGKGGQSQKTGQSPFSSSPFLKDLFVKELEVALQEREIDVAVHSMKDLPAEIPDDLTLAAFPKREDPSDVLVTAQNLSIDDLPKHSVIGTSALRRQSQLLLYRPDLQIKLLRGNVDTRLKKLDAGQYFGIILAKAGLNRLGIRRGTPIPHAILLPSPGQGALALEARRNDPILQILKKLNDQETELCVRAERSFLQTMEGGCQVPLGAFASLNGKILTLEGFWGTDDGTVGIRNKERGDAGNPEKVGKIVAERLLKQAGSRKALSNNIQS